MTTIAQPQPLADHIRTLMTRRRWSERDFALRMMDGAGMGEAGFLVRILLSGIDCPLDPLTAGRLGRATGVSSRVWLERDAAWRAWIA